MNVKQRVAFTLSVFLVAASTAADVRAPRVISAHNADGYSMKTFADFHRWRALADDERAWEIYKYLVDTRTGLFHMNEVREGSDTLSEYATIRDPVKLLNVYGYGYCAIFGPFMAGVCEEAGIGPARSLILADWNHVLAETFYKDRWHYLDVDVRAAFRRPDGTLASFEESRTDPGLWVNRGPQFFPNDDLEHVRKVYEATPFYCHYGFHQTGHTMDYVLRQGETFTRWWTPQGGRWHHLPAYHKSDFMRRLIEKEPRGPAPNHRHFTVHNYGNGRFVYRPNLTSASTDFADGVYDSQNVVTARTGLSVKDDGTGYAVFEIRTPYIIVPKVGQLETTEDDCEASVVEIDATDASLSVSLDNGFTWQPVASVDAREQFDLTELVAGTYGYLLRIELKGVPGSAEVRKLGVTTWVQVAPAALPSLRSGRNRMEFRSGDHYGLASRVVAVCSDTSKPDEFRKIVVRMPDDYDPERKTGRIRGEVIAKVTPPPGSQIAWFTAEGSFRTHQQKAATQTQNTIGYAVGTPRDFVEIYRSEMPTDMGHWHYNAAREVQLDEPVDRLFVRYIGDPAVNNFKIYAHCVDKALKSASPVVITHTWTENGAERTHRVELPGTGAYEIVAGTDPVDKSIEIAVPSDGPVEVALAPQARGAESPGWVEAMREVHSRFKGERGTFAQFGDSITDSRAFWYSLKWKRANASPEMVAAFETVNSYMLEDCWDRKGANYGNQSGQTIRWASKNLDTWLRGWNPEAAILMFGTNDLNNVSVQDYEQALEEVVERCLANGTIIILSTIPPRHGKVEKAAAFAEAARRVARKLRVPLVDFHAEILARRPDDWDGVLDQFSGHQGYDVPTLIARDGVHPSNPKKYQADYSPEALNSCGFSLRNYLVLMKYAEVIQDVLKGKRE